MHIKRPFHFPTVFGSCIHPWREWDNPVVLGSVDDRGNQDAKPLIFGTGHMTEPEGTTRTDMQALRAVLLKIHRPEWRQGELANWLEVGQPQVSRLLRQATEKGWIRERIELCIRNIPPRLLAEVTPEFSTVRVRLEEALLDRCRRLLSIDVGPADRDLFYQFAADTILRILENAGSRKAGVAFGYNLAQIFRLLAQPAETDPLFQCFPLSGEPVFLTHTPRLHRDVTYQSTALAAALQAVISGVAHQDMPMLAGIPAYIPHAYCGEGSKVLEFVRRIPGYTQIFGDMSSEAKTEGEVETLDALLTGLGVVSDKLEECGTFYRERYQSDPDLCRKHRGNLIGDIAGLVFTDTESGERADSVRVLNEGLVGLKLRHLRDCASRAAEAKSDEKEPGGVVVCTTGTPREKARAILVAVRGDLVNRLVLPETIAAEMLRLVEESDGI